MDLLVLLARVALAAVFATSGVAKLLDRRGTREAVEGFGVPAALVGTVAGALPFVELVAAVLLVPGPTGRLGALLALALLVAFSAAVAVALAQGRRPECHCFGRIGGSDVSGRTLVRNAVLAVLALVALSRAGEGPLGLDGGAALAAVAGGLVLAAAVVLVEAAAGRADLRRREAARDAAFDAGMAEPTERGPAPLLTLPGLDGRPVHLADHLDAHRPTLVVFLSPGCGPCRTLLPSVKRWSELYADRLGVVVVTSGDADGNRELYADTPGLPVLLDPEREGRDAYAVNGTPSAALVRPDGLLGGPLGVGGGNVRRLLAAGLAGTEPDLDAPYATDGAPVETIGLDSVLGPRPTVTTHTVDETLVVVDELTGATLSLDRIGGVVWQCLDGVSLLRDIVEDLADAFSAPVEVVGADVLELARSVGRAGMLVGISPEVPDTEVVHDDPHAGHQHAHV